MEEISWTKEFQSERTLDVLSHFLGKKGGGGGSGVASKNLSCSEWPLTETQMPLQFLQTC